MFDDLKTIIAFFRGTSGVTLKQALLAALAIAKIGVDQLADTVTSVPPTTPPGTSAIADPEAMVQQFEKIVQQYESSHGQQAVFALPWATIIPLLMQLFQSWLAGRGTPTTPAAGS